MISLQSLKFLIGQKTTEYAAGLEIYDQVIISAISYTIYTNNMQDNNMTIDLDSNVDKIVQNTFNDILEYKQKYASYYRLRSYVVSINKSNLFSLNDSQIATIYQMSLERILQPDFSTVTFNTEMYNSVSLQFAFQERLSRIHYKIMVPIIQYYHDRFNIPIRNMSIGDISSVQTNPGKVIYFSISGIDSSTVVNDINSDIFGIGKYVYKVNVEEELVKLIVK